MIALMDTTLNKLLVNSGLDGIHIIRVLYREQRKL